MSSRPNPDDGTWNIDFVVHLQFPHQVQVEKNWCPLVDADAPLRIVYSMQPFVLLEPDIVTGYCRIVTNIEYKFKLPGVPYSQPNLRGSTPWVPFQDGWLAVGHYVYFLEPLNHQRVYYHFFMCIQKEFNEISVSHPFHFEEHVIEFATGLISDQDCVVISFSAMDSALRQVSIPSSEVCRRLKPL